ncbi:hypothetical protein KSS94_26295 [Pseudomonas fakonensis]|uniref:Uncharacterized protein n=1 Tax=Pseudomonas fakonensis TaxID=2842355 RepID=A0ABX8ND68_9PSED|nr:hypothetical protein [Pseudomonas fakonensis]QXH54291.1 hypothetical protein KSS94_26295 [Pseudomonas fakonensis]
MQRVDLAGKGQALDGDLTTTGATCITSSPKVGMSAGETLGEIVYEHIDP